MTATSDLTSMTLSSARHLLYPLQELERAMKRVCGWCGRCLDECGDASKEPVTHGLCPACRDLFFAVCPQSRLRPRTFDAEPPPPPVCRHPEQTSNPWYS